LSTLNQACPDRELLFADVPSIERFTDQPVLSAIDICLLQPAETFG